MYQMIISMFQMKHLNGISIKFNLFQLKQSMQHNLIITSCFESPLRWNNFEYKYIYINEIRQKHVRFVDFVNIYSVCYRCSVCHRRNRKKEKKIYRITAPMKTRVLFVLILCQLRTDVRSVMRQLRGKYLVWWSSFIFNM